MTQTTNLTGSCFCRAVEYKLSLDSPDQARNSLCHCNNCKKAFGGDFGLTVKIPRAGLQVTKGEDVLTKFKDTKSSGVTREFCSQCGSYIQEYGEAAGDHTYLVWGSLDDHTALPPKGEFFCRYRSAWMPPIPDTFQKLEVKE